MAPAEVPGAGQRSSPITKRVYNLGLDEFFAWYGQEPRAGFTKATVSGELALHSELSPRVVLLHRFSDRFGEFCAAEILERSEFTQDSPFDGIEVQMHPHDDIRQRVARTVLTVIGNGQGHTVIQKRRHGCDWFAYGGLRPSLAAEQWSRPQFDAARA